MNQLIITILLCLFPSLVLADTTGMGFTPPIGDVSVVFLSNLFGTVDAVLSSGGSGSQMLGALFMVFNSAVLALGGIIIIYTLLVSTMNTAHEGQMLGQKWSSIWIPLRSILGIGMLVPKASGYCLMQIFVMWIVIQGVGAADKVWNAALSYLNRGGLIIQSQSANPTQALLNNSATSGIPAGAQEILSGQVCMVALQKQLTAQRQIYLDNTKNDKGPCAPGNNNLLRSFCDTPVPEFLNSVNAVDFQNQNLKNAKYEMPMPNFPTDNLPYSTLNGICGWIRWKPIDHFATNSNAIDPVQKQMQDALSADEYKTAQLTRAIAIQQMYVDLSLVARLIVTNDPQIGKTPKNQGAPNKNFAPFAKQQYGVPLDAQSHVCTTYGNCTGWGPTNPAFGVLFNGTEFQSAIQDYNGIMQPTLNLLNKATVPAGTDTTRDFIKQAQAQGWLMAGAYFFDLIKLNSAARTTAESTDSNTGLGDSKFDPTAFADPKYNILTLWFEKFQSTIPRIDEIKTLFDGSGLSKKPDLTKPDPNRSLIDGLGSSTVYGFTNNSMMITLPGQQGIKPLQFAGTLSFTTSGSPITLQPLPLNCDWKIHIIFFTWCISDTLISVFYNGLFLSIANDLLSNMLQVLENVMNILLWVPLQGLALIFKQGVSTLTQPGVNPIVALANMGVMYINFAGNLWIYTITLGSPFLIFPSVFGILMLGMPIIFSWLAVMVSISMVTAYYIPLLPYMMFVFGGIGWFMIVIEAMVAAPLIAVGVTHPEGEGAFGKGEHAIMILLNVFLRPAMMIIGFIAGIALSYVGVWLLNTGFDHAISYMQGGPDQAGAFDSGTWYTAPTGTGEGGGMTPGTTDVTQGSGSGATLYSDWAGLFAFFFSVLSYTTMYLIIVQKSFTLIGILPDKVLRWIGGTPEGAGQEAAQWGEETKSEIKGAGEKAYSAQVQIGKTGAAAAEKGALWAKKKIRGLKGDIQAQDNKPNAPDGAKTG